MKKRFKFIAALGAFAVFLVISMLAYNSLAENNRPDNALSATEGSGEVGPQGNGADSAPDKIKAPDFTVFDMDNNEVKLSDMLGEPVVVNFWASWCPPCKSEMPDFDKVFGEMGDKVNFMMIDLVGGRETRQSGEKYIEEQGFSFPVYFDTTQEAAIAYGVTSIPTSLFIDKNGYIAAAAQGAIDESSLRYGVGLIYDGVDNNNGEQEDEPVKYLKITPAQAKKMMESGDEYILLDVRTRAEYDEGHIDGARLIPDTQIAARAADELPEKDAAILVYCRSGRRSALAANELIGLGYTCVYDFGGITDWPYALTK